MTENVLDKLRQNRNRPNVPNRQDSLIPEKEIVRTESHLVEDDLNAKDRLKVVQSSNAYSLQELESELAAIPKTVRHSAIVIDETIDQPLTAFCKNNKITVELFLEAAWNLANSDPVCLETILKDAKQRYKVRKRGGKLRRLITMLTK